MTDREAAAGLVERAAAFEAYAREVTKALTGLVGGGSEMFSGMIGDDFCKADLQHCVERMRDRFTRAGDREKELHKRLKAAEARGRLAALLRAVAGKEA